MKAEEVIIDAVIEASRKLPLDAVKALEKAYEVEEGNSKVVLKAILDNLDLAGSLEIPLCQDTGTILFYISHPVGFNQRDFTKVINQAVVAATKKGYLRQNSVDSLTGENSGMNIGLGHPSIHYHEHGKKSVEMKLMLKGGGGGCCL